MDKIYCNECKKDVKPIKGKCPNCGLKFNSDLLENENIYSAEKNIVSLSLKIIASITFLIGMFLAIFHFESIKIMFFIILLCMLIFALAEIIQICHDIRHKLYK